MLNKISSHITVFEHETIRFDKGKKTITEQQFHALEKYHGGGVPFFTLCYNGLKFNEHVGILQVGNTLIEVLPKTDRYATDKDGEDTWRRILIQMIKAVGHLNISKTGSGRLKIKPNTILDLYFEIFISEVEYLLNSGLVKKYRKAEANQTSLKGSLHFSKNIQKNLIHKERFYVRYTAYDTCHLLHVILYQTIKVINLLNANSGLQSRLNNLLLRFPEMRTQKINASVFHKISYNRKTHGYKNAIEIARLILLNFHPDIAKGRNDVLALMFDMNVLWEKFVYTSLRKHYQAGVSVIPQSSRSFWKPGEGYRSKMKPDIVIKKDEGNSVVLDTKWKNTSGANPSPDDLRQMFVYMKYYKATKVALIYPGSKSSILSGKYFDHMSLSTELLSNEECSVITIEKYDNVREWQKHIYDWVNGWIDGE